MTFHSCNTAVYYFCYRTVFKLNNIAINITVVLSQGTNDKKSNQLYENLKKLMNKESKR